MNNIEGALSKIESEWSDFSCLRILILNAITQSLTTNTTVVSLGGGIRHNSTQWNDQDGHHRESYNYDREGNIENLYTDKGPGPWNR